ncbi:conserved exported hypothetical protein [Tenacibaculum sp. 190524A02b]|uniref:Uncharacterized protein n=1 Tax=Tenacibaculum vairaonense TaxID=3137860 RepID=A0ABP1FD49_9FLAO
MKKLVCTLAMVALGMQAQAQTTVITEKDGKVGIGTTDPNSKLEVKGTSMAASGAGTLRVTGSGPASLRIGTMNEYSWVQSHGSKPLYINELGNNVVINKNAGNLGIGTTDPKKKLHVNGTLGVSDHFTSYRPGSNTFLRFDDAGYTGIGSGSTLSSGANILLYGKSSSRADVIAFRNSKGEKVVIDKNGYLGIGTPAPVSRLDITNGEYKTYFTGNALTFKNKNVTSYVDKRDEGSLRFRMGVNYNTAMTLTSDLRLGIGTTSPRSRLDLGGRVGADKGFRLGDYIEINEREDINNAGVISFNASIDSNDISKFKPAWTGSTAASGMILSMASGGRSDLTFYGYKWGTDATPRALNEFTKVLHLGVDGNVGIGTTKIPTGYKLAVDGKIGAREIKVESRAWPDYVFTKDYNLPTLKEVENHIKEKGHLPNIPSAKEVEVNKGIELGEMNRKLLEKVEELTLYTIQQEKQLKKQSEELNELKQLVQQLVKTKK